MEVHIVPEQLHLLVVDDTPTFRMLLQVILTKEGYQVHVADSVASAEQILQAYPIDLILLDKEMPGESGLSFCKRLAEDPTHTAPVLFVSSHVSGQSRVDGLRVGAVDYLCRPISTSEVLLRVKIHLQLCETQRIVQQKVQELEAVNMQMKVDLHAASRVQRAMLPLQAMNLGKVEVSYEYVPCDFLAGDGLGYMMLTHNMLAFYMIDASGHGVPAALLSVSMMQELSALESGVIWEKPGVPAQPSEVLTRLNEKHDMKRDGGRYATACYGLIDTDTGEVTLSCAGHTPPMVARMDGTCQEISMPSVPIGMGLPSAYENRRFFLEPSDRLYFYTDGITEAAPLDGEEFGEERLQNILLDGLSYHLRESLTMVKKAVSEWLQHQKPDDDVTIMCVEFLG